MPRGHVNALVYNTIIQTHLPYISHPIQLTYLFSAMHCQLQWPIYDGVYGSISRDIGYIYDK